MRWIGRQRRTTAFLLAEQGKPPPALSAFSLNVLCAHGPPEQVVVSQVAPPTADLRGAAKRDSVGKAEDLEADFARECGERIETGVGGELGLQDTQLRRTAHGQDAVQNEGAAGMRRAAEKGPNCVDRELIRQRELFNGLWGAQPMSECMRVHVCGETKDVRAGA